MIIVSTIVYNHDNSGAKISKCVNVPKICRAIGAQAGNVIRVLIKMKVPKRHIKKKSKMVTKGQICKAIVVQQKGFLRRRGHFMLKGSLNAVVLLNEYDMPYATRVFGVVFKEVRQRSKYKKLVSLAQYVI